MQRYLLQRATTTSLRSRPRPPPPPRLAGPEIPSSMTSSSDKSSELCRDKSEQPKIQIQIQIPGPNAGQWRRVARQQFILRTKAPGCT